MIKLKTSLFLLVIVFANALTINAFASPVAKNTGAYFELKVYHFSNSSQEATIDSFLQYQYVPSMNASGISNIGIFKAIANDTATDKRVYVFTPFKSLKQWESISKDVYRFEQAANGTTGYVDAAYNKPVFGRIENIFLRAFDLMPKVAPSKLTGPKSQRVYELRSYEGTSEKIHRNKVRMFNEGGEVPLFERLGFNAVFYGAVLFGCKMPNLMYMTSFENMNSRTEHWKAFRADPEWEKLSAMPEYQRNVSQNEIVFLRPTEYSQL